MFQSFVSKMLERIKLIDAFKFNFIILKCIGAWNFNNVKYKMYKHTLTIISISMCLSTIIEIAKDVENRHMFYTAMAEFVVPLKIIIFRKEFKKISSTFVVLTSDSFQPKNTKQKKIQQEAIRLAQNLQFAYFCILGVVIVVIYIPNYLWQKLPLLLWIPFDYKKPIYYEVAFLYALFGGAYCGYSNISIDSFLCISWIQIEAQFKCICNTLQNLKKISKSDKKEKKLIFLECVHHYNVLQKYVELLSDSYSGIITVQVLFSTLSICSTMYYMSLVGTNI